MKINEHSFYYRYCIVIPDNLSPISEYFIKILKENDFAVHTYTDNLKPKSMFISISQTNENKFFEHGEILSVRKIYTGERKNIIKVDGLPKQIQDLEKQKNIHANTKNLFIPANDYYELYFDSKEKHNKVENINDDNERWGLNLFTEAEMLSIEKSILDNIKIPNKEEFTSLIINTYKSINVEAQNLDLIDTNSLFNTLVNLKIVTEHFPLNISNFNKKIINKTIFSFRCPQNLIRSYYGDSVAIYFYWVFYYTKLLIIPSLVSILFYLMKYLFPKIETSLTTLNSLFISFWAHLFTVFWTRRTYELQIEWDNYDTYFEKENLRKEFKGETSINKVNGKMEETYPTKKRLVNYLISVSITLGVIALLMAINVIFLNISGFIKESVGGVLYIPFVANLAKEEGFLGRHPTLLSLMSIIQGILIQILNTFGNKVAKITTDLENHREKSHYENSLIIKRFLLTFCDTFFCPYYLAFVLADYQATSNFLKDILYSSEAKRVITSTILPLILKSLFTKTMMLSIGSSGNKDRLLLDKEFDDNEVVRQRGLDQFTTYGEYLEIMIEFCYLTIFSRYIPLSGLLIILINIIEIRSDILKLGTIYKRTLPLRAKDIGSWQIIFTFIAWISVFVNLLTSYDFYTDEGYRNKYKDLQSFCIWEHIIIICSVLVRVFWPIIPGWVDLFLKRREYRRSMKKIEKTQGNESK